MIIHIKNKLSEKISICLGMKEYQLEQEEEITAECEDEDVLYLDRID